MFHFKKWKKVKCFQVLPCHDLSLSPLFTFHNDFCTVFPRVHAAIRYQTQPFKHQHQNRSLWISIARHGSRCTGQTSQKTGRLYAPSQSSETRVCCLKLSAARGVAKICSEGRQSHRQSLRQHQLCTGSAPGDKVNQIRTRQLSRNLGEWSRLLLRTRRLIPTRPRTPCSTQHLRLQQRANLIPGGDVSVTHIRPAHGSFEKIAGPRPSPLPSAQEKPACP